jgi:ComF family protein
MPDGLQVIRSVGPHAGWLQRSIHAMKYDGERVRARHLGALMRPWLVELLAAEPTALVVPVPLHVDRLRGRGFNQSLLVARHAVHSDPWPIASAAVARVRSTRQQVHLSLSERERNVSGAFEADPLVVANRPILLVDDVFTTGSTLMACAAALRDAGATDIAAVTLSRAHWTASTWA